MGQFSCFFMKSQMPENAWSAWTQCIASKGPETCQLWSYQCAFFEFWAFSCFSGSFLTIFWPKIVIFRFFFSKNDQKSIFFIRNQWKRCFLSTTTSLETIKTNRTFKNLIFSRFSISSRFGPILPRRVQCGVTLIKREVWV